MEGSGRRARHLPAWLLDYRKIHARAESSPAETGGLRRSQAR